MTLSRKTIWTLLALAAILAPLLSAQCGCTIEGRRSSQHPYSQGWRFNKQHDEWQQVNEFGVVTNTQPTINKVIRDNQ